MRKLILIALLITSTVAKAAGSTFMGAGTMSTDRFGHAGLLLPDGRVLILGGYQWRVPPDAPLPRDTSELYNSTSMLFTPSTRMTAGHAEVWAFLLRTGKVAVSSRYARSLELYDALLSNSRSVPGTLPEIYEASISYDGKVVLYGATCETCAPLNAYIYDPSTDRILPSATIGPGRSGATATLLLNKKILITGGSTYSFANGYTQTFLATAQLLDPATDAIQPTGSMLARRVNHSATLLPNGKVVIVGGVGGRGPLCTATERCVTLSSAELYDPTTGTFAPSAGRLNVPTFLHTATLLTDGKVLIAGGDTGDGNPTSRAELYDPSSDTFTRIPGMSTPRAWHSATLLLNGYVLVAGGYTRLGNNRPGVSTTELYASDGPGCSFSVSLSQQTFPAPGGNARLEVSAPIGCAWRATTSDTWITMSSQNTGNGPGFVDYSISANTSNNTRTGRISVANQVVAITQNAVARRRAVRH